MTLTITSSGRERQRRMETPTKTTKGIMYKRSGNEISKLVIRMPQESCTERELRQS